MVPGDLGEHQEPRQGSVSHASPPTAAAARHAARADGPATFGASSRAPPRGLRPPNPAALNIPRYKVVVQVTIGEMKHQGVMLSSKCLWDPNTDNYASETFSNVRPGGLPTEGGCHLWSPPADTAPRSNRCGAPPWCLDVTRSSAAVQRACMYFVHVLQPWAVPVGATRPWRKRGDQLRPLSPPSSPATPRLPTPSAQPNQLLRAPPTQ